MGIAFTDQRVKMGLEKKRTGRPGVLVLNGIFVAGWKRWGEGGGG